MAKSGTNLGLVDQRSDVPPSRDINWPRVILCQFSLTFGQPLDQADCWSDVPSVEASSGQEWYCQVSLTFHEPLCQTDLWSDVPPQ